MRKVDPAHPETAATLTKLHGACFPDFDPFTQLHGDWWIAYDRETKAPVAFAGLWPSVRQQGAGYLVRAGVLPEARGKGLQRRLVKVRVREAKKKGWIALYSDVAPGNAHSLNNLFAEGFRAFIPSQPWSGAEWNYLRRIIDEGVA